MRKNVYICGRKLEKRIRNMIRILINRLGRIRGAEIEVKPFMVFTGDSGLGKSYTAFLVDHVHQCIAGKRTVKFIREHLQQITSEKNPRVDFAFTLGDFRSWMEQDAERHLRYLTGNGALRLSVGYELGLPDDMEFRFSFSDNGDPAYCRYTFNGETNSYPKDFFDWPKLYAQSFSGALLVRVAEGIGVLNSVVLPPARAAFMGARNAKEAFRSIGLYGDFIDLLDELHSAARTDTLDNDILRTVNLLCEGDLITREGQTLLRLHDGRTEIPISAAASSAKELAAFCLLMLRTDEIGDYSILFEEPEAHVHPMKQNRVADAIARCRRRGTLFQITTHSDYLLSRFNQLIRLGKMRQADKGRFESFCQGNDISSDLYLQPDEVAAYYFREGADGSVTIERQDVTSGIPFTSFRDIVTQQERVDDQIETMMEE